MKNPIMQQQSYFLYFAHFVYFYILYILYILYICTYTCRSLTRVRPPLRTRLRTPLRKHISCAFCFCCFLRQCAQQEPATISRQGVRKGFHKDLQCLKAVEKQMTLACDPCRSKWALKNKPKIDIFFLNLYNICDSIYINFIDIS